MTNLSEYNSEQLKNTIIEYGKELHVLGSEIKALDPINNPSHVGREALLVSRYREIADLRRACNHELKIRLKNNVIEGSNIDLNNENLWTDNGPGLNPPPTNGGTPLAQAV